MLARLGIFVTILAAALGLHFTGYFTAAKCLFALAVLLAFEVAMFRLYTLSHLNIKIGKAKDAELIKGDDTNYHELLCIPISIRVEWWEVKGISFVVRSNDDHANSELFNRRGISLEGFDGTYTLDWRIKRGYASLAFLAGSAIHIGNPIILHPIPLQDSYPIILEVWHSDNLISDSQYTLNVVDKKMFLSDVK
jgi:hypothetical protein